MNEMLTCMYKTGPPPPTKTPKTTPSLMPPPDEIHRGVEIVINTDIDDRVSKSCHKHLKYSLMLVK